MPQTPDVNLGLLSDDTCVCERERETDHKEVMFSEICSRVSAVETRCDPWYIKMKIRLRPFTYLIDIGPLMLIIYSLDRISSFSVV
jgi:hypothetical protein